MYTTTQANGAPSIVTSVTVVPADQAAGQTSAPKPTGTNTGNASLQTNDVGICTRHLGLTTLMAGVAMVVAWAL